MQLLLAQLAASGQGANGAAAQALLAQLAAGQAPSGAAVQALTAQLTTRLNNLGVSVPLPGVLTGNMGALGTRPQLAPDGASVPAAGPSISDQITLGQSAAAGAQQPHLSLPDRARTTRPLPPPGLALSRREAKEAYNGALADCNDYMTAARAAQAAGTTPPDQQR